MVFPIGRILWFARLLLFLGLRVLTGDLFVNDLNGSFEHHGQLQNSVVFRVKLVQLENKPFTCLIDPQVVPLAPSPVVTQLLPPDLGVRALDFLELLHELEINGGNLIGAFEPGAFDGFALRYLDIEPDEEVGKKLHIQKLAPSVA